MPAAGTADTSSSLAPQQQQRDKARHHAATAAAAAAALGGSGGRHGSKPGRLSQWLLLVVCTAMVALFTSSHSLQTGEPPGGAPR
jgi:hypothetical protein